MTAQEFRNVIMFDYTKFGTMVDWVELQPEDFESLLDDLQSLGNPVWAHAGAECIGIKIMGITVYVA